MDEAIMNDLFQKIRNVTKDFEHEHGAIVAFDVAMAGDVITVQPITDLYAPTTPGGITADDLPVSLPRPTRKGPANDPLKDRKGL